MRLFAYLFTCVIGQVRVELMNMMRDAGVIDAETDELVAGSATDSEQTAAFRHLLQTTDDLAVLDRLDEVTFTTLSK